MTDPDAILLWRADECAAPGPVHACCLRATEPGSRAVVYRTREDQGIAGTVDFSSAATSRPGGGWVAAGRFTPLSRPIPRADLLADDVLRPVFRALRSRRGLPDAAARRLAELIGD
ncbi:hypothetical protein [Pseudonocardia xishanensis]|uniref:Uncharacterized protein n=1 Tax=Pseudonocardia xishanensis TaxID=630995 RepID=A0ABP8S3G8_9PSEU